MLEAHRFSTKGFFFIALIHLTSGQMHLSGAVPVFRNIRKKHPELGSGQHRYHPVHSQGGHIVSLLVCSACTHMHTSSFCKACCSLRDKLYYFIALQVDIF